jgi:AAA15 family ATPase/GTPase
MNQKKSLGVRKMLISYRFNNFCSFNCESEFSMCSATGKVKRRFPDNFVTFEQGYDLLKTSVIVGENAGGKSNFINSLS